MNPSPRRAPLRRSCLLVACAGSSSGVPGTNNGEARAGSSGSSSSGSSSSGSTFQRQQQREQHEQQRELEQRQLVGRKQQRLVQRRLRELRFVCSGPAEVARAATCAAARFPVTGGTIPNCTTGAISVACDGGSECATKTATSCSGTQVVRLCKQPADCTETGAPKCCTFTQDGGALSFCANGIIAGLGGGTCM